MTARNPPSAATRDQVPRSGALAQQPLIDVGDSWFRRYAVDIPSVRLVCLPHAGGTAGMFHDWYELLAPGIEVLAVQYPGRQDRLGEQPPRSLEELADEIAGRLLPYLDVPVSLFGHSMGASVAYEVARRLEDWYPQALNHLYVSGRSAPGHELAGTAHPVSDDDLADWTVAAGEPGSHLYRDPELRDLLLPSLRGDLTLLDAYKPAEVIRLKAPITAFGGTADPGCTPEDLATWAEVTASGFGLQVFEGNHFYLVPHAAAVTAEISSRSIIHDAPSFQSEAPSLQSPERQHTTTAPPGKELKNDRASMP
ncbi:alpha/beta fold hydrolase [Streptomyces sp. NBC_00414]|uniref:thioesterase II family protein n=1 Tax=Streptomyces sp. NBC_00414 TaxID=2975739 RepID=UPI002E1D5282